MKAKNKHDNLIKLFRAEYNDFFDIVKENLEYNVWGANGEIDLFLYNVKYDTIWLCEMKSNKKYRKKAVEQLHRAKDFFLPTTGFKYKNLDLIHCFYNNKGEEIRNIIYSRKSF